MKKQLLKIIQNRWVILIFCLLFSLLLFSNTFQNDFVFDDVPTIRDNAILKNIQNIPQLFFSYYYHSPAGLYRPIQMISYSFNYFFFGQGVWSFHLINIILHALNCWLLFLLVRKLTKNINLAYLTNWLFLILPIHTEAVTGLVGRAELLAFFFSFLTIILLLNNKKWHVFIASFCFLLGLLSKETAMAILPIYLFILLYQEKKIISLKKYYLEIICLLVILIFYFLLRYLVLGEYIFSNNATIVENPLKFVSTRVRILTALKILTLYLWKIIFPLHLSSDYSYNQIPIVNNLLNLPALIGLIFLISLLYLLLRPEKNLSSFYFGVVFFFWPFLIISNLITPIGTIMAERLMYFPSVGICLIMAGFFYYLFRRIYFNFSVLFETHSHECANDYLKIFSKIFVLLIFSILSIFYILRTWQRNYDWQNQKTLFLSAAKASPNSVLSRSNAGAIYLLEGKYDEAEKEISAAIKIYPYYPQAVNNLGLIYRHYGEYEKAEEQFLKTLEISPDYSGAFENLGLLYLDWEKYPEAKKWLLKFFDNDKTKVDLYFQQYFEMKIRQALIQNDENLVNQWLKKAQEAFKTINQ